MADTAPDGSDFDRRLGGARMDVPRLCRTPFLEHDTVDERPRRSRPNRFHAVAPANDSSGHTGGNNIVRQRLRHDSSSRDDRLAADVGHHDRVTANPRTGTDSDRSELSWLLSNG